MSDDRFTITVREAARRLSVTERHVYNLIQRGEMPVVRLGRATRIPLVALERLVEEASADPTTKGGPSGR